MKKKIKNDKKLKKVKKVVKIVSPIVSTFVPPLAKVIPFM